jgi:transcription-repair coupling factor (superfamily II helicase)
VTQVVAAGEYSVRGGLVDLFPMGTQLPYRIELFDDEIETIRSFDVDSQRSLYPVPEIRLLPAREFPAGEAGRTTFRQRFREAFEGDASRISLYKDVSNGILPAGIEYYLPLFFESTGDAVRLPAGRSHAAAAWRRRRRDRRVLEPTRRGRYKMLGGDRSRPVLPPGELFLRDEEFFVAAKALPQLVLKVMAPCGTALATGDPAAAGRRTARPTIRWPPARLPRRHAGRVLLLAESPGRRQTLADYLAEYGLRLNPAGFRRLPRPRVALHARRRPALRRLPAGQHRRRHGKRALRRHGAPARAPHRCPPRQPRRLAARPVRTEGRRSGGA